jgi:dihydroorotase
MPGVQTILTIMLDHVNQGRLTLEKLVNLLCLRPAELYSLRNKGKLAIGYDADITIVDMNKTHTIANGEQASKCGWTPYDGKKVKGFPVRTIVHGHTVMDNGELVGSPMGQPICR